MVQVLIFELILYFQDENEDNQCKIGERELLQKQICLMKEELRIKGKRIKE